MGMHIAYRSCFYIKYLIMILIQLEKDSIGLIGNKLYGRVSVSFVLAAIIKKYSKYARIAPSSLDLLTEAKCCSIVLGFARLF